MDALIRSSAELLAKPTSLFALLAVLILILGYLQTRRIHFTTHMLINVALMLALTIVLHQLRIFHMPQGGSVTIGGMIPLLFLTYRYGAGIGCLAGFLYGMINLMQDAFILHPLQVLFDYPLPYMALAIAAAVPSREPHSPLRHASLATLSRVLYSSVHTRRRECRLICIPSCSMRPTSSPRR